MASTEDTLDLERLADAADDAIHARISAKDAIVTELTSSTPKGKAHASYEVLPQCALGQYPDATTAEHGPRELTSAKGEVAYGTTLATRAKAEPLVRRARALVDLAIQIVPFAGLRRRQPDRTTAIAPSRAPDQMTSGP